MEAVNKTFVPPQVAEKRDAAEQLRKTFRRFQRSANAPLMDAVAPETLTDVSAAHN